jgi:hypothetical protein
MSQTRRSPASPAGPASTIHVLDDAAASIVVEAPAYPVVFVGKRGAVTVTAEGRHFVVAGTSGYRAELIACECERTPCPRPRNHPCGKAAERREHARTHCHDWHARRAYRFALKVLATYGTKRVTPDPACPPCGCGRPKCADGPDTSRCDGGWHAGPPCDHACISPTRQEPTS